MNFPSSNFFLYKLSTDFRKNRPAKRACREIDRSSRDGGNDRDRDSCNDTDGGRDGSNGRDRICTMNANKDADSSTGE